MKKEQENEVTTMIDDYFPQKHFSQQLCTGDARLNTELLLVGGKPWILQRKGEI